MFGEEFSTEGEALLPMQKAHRFGQALLLRRRGLVFQRRLVEIKAIAHITSSSARTAAAKREKGEAESLAKETALSQGSKGDSQVTT